MWRGVLVAFLLVSGDVRTAAACTCGFEFQLPARDTADVPVNLRDLVFASSSTAAEYSLQAGSSAVAFGTPRQVWGSSQPVHLVPLAAPLEPNTVYTLWRNGGVLSQFRTSAAPDDEPPGAVGLEDVAIQFVDNPVGSSCGVKRFSVSGRLVVPPDAASIWVRFARAGEVQERLLPASATTLSSLGTTACSVRLDLEPDTMYEVDVWARDLAGNEGPLTTKSVYIRDAGGGCATTPSSSFLLTTLALLIRRRRVAVVRARA